MSKLEAHRRLLMMLAVAMKLAGFQDYHDTIKTQISGVKNAQTLWKYCDSAIGSILQEEHFKNEKELHRLARQFETINNDLGDGQFKPKQIDAIFLGLAKRDAWRCIARELSKDLDKTQEEHDAKSTFPPDFARRVQEAFSEEEFRSLCFEGIEQLELLADDGTSQHIKLLNGVIDGVEKAKTEGRVDNLLIAVR